MVNSHERTGPNMPTETTSSSVPLTVITGFLGSGKTTTLTNILADPRMAGAAVIINEFGEIGLDHLLVERPREDVVLLESGCLCCTVRGDLVNTLTGLFIARARGEIMAFDRILVETTGLANPIPVLQTAHADPELANLLHVEHVITTVDAVHGGEQIRTHPECVKQICTADTVLITKTDLADRAAVDCLRTDIEHLNPGAEQIDVINGQIAPDRIFAALRGAPASVSGPPHRIHHDTSGDDTHAPHEHAHSKHHVHDEAHHAAGITSYSIIVETPVTANGLQVWTQMLSDFNGADLLRIKGVVNIEGRPYVLQAVQHLVHPLTELPAWPSDDRRTRLIFITRNIPRAAIERTLHALALDLPQRNVTGFDAEGFRRFAAVASIFR